jgi:SAM-dependent methyltransferase
MTSHNFDKIKSIYQESFDRFGDSPASLLTPKGRNEMRYGALDEFIRENPNYSVADYGCGLGYLYAYLKTTGYRGQYSGYDILPAFIDKCREKFQSETANPAAKFDVIDADKPIENRYDIVFSSGVFNLKTTKDEAVSKQYAFDKVKELFDCCDHALVCDFLSPYVDFQQDEAQHFSVAEIADFCAKYLTRRFIIRHDILPYEFTLIAYKVDAIKRPENIFAVHEGSSREGQP